MAQGNSGSSRSRKKPVVSEEDAAGLRMLSSELRTLTKVVGNLQTTFQTFNAGNRDLGQEVAVTVQGTELIKKNFDSLSDLINSNVKKTKEFSAITQIIGTSQSTIASIIADQVKNAEANNIEKLKEQGLSDRSIELIKQREQLEKGIKTLQDELVDLTGDQLTAQQKLIDLANEQLDQIKAYEDDEQAITKLLKAKTKELEKEKVITESINTVGSKLTETLGAQGDELIEIGKAFKHSLISPLALVGALIGNALEEFGKIGRESRAFLDTSKLTVKQSEHLLHYAHDLSLEYRAQGVEMKDVLDSTNALVNQFGSLNRVSDKAVEKATLLGKSFGISADNAAGVMAQLQRSTGVSAETAGNIAALGANFAKAAGVAPDAVMQDIASSSEEIATYFRGTPKDLFKTAVEARRLGLDLKKVANISQSLLNFESSIEDQMTASVLLGREINLDKARQLAMEGKLEDAAKETLSQVGSLADFNKMNAVQKEAIAKAAGLTVGDLQKSLEAQEAIKDMTVEQRTEYEKGLKALNDGNESAADRLLKEQRNQLTQEKIADAVAKISDIFANVLLPVIEPILDVIAGIFRYVDLILPLLKTGLQIFLGWKAVSFLLNTQFFKTRGLLGSLAAPFQMIGKGISGAWNGMGKAYNSTKSWVSSLKEGDGITKNLWTKLKGVGSTIKQFLIGKGFKAWGKEGEDAVEKVSSKSKGFFDKFKELMSKMSFGTLKEKAAEVPTPAAEEAEGGGDLASTIQDKAKEKGGELIDSVTGKSDEAVDAEQKMASSPGEGIKTFFKNLSAGLSSMSSAKVKQGALNLIPAAKGLILMIPGYFGAKLLEKLNGEKIQTNLYGLAYGLGDFGSAKVRKGTQNLMLAGAGFLIFTLALPGLLTVSLLGKVAGKGLEGLSKGVAAMGGPKIIMGALGIAVLGASIIPAAIGFSMLAGVDASAILAFTVSLLALTAATIPMAALVSTGVLELAAIGFALLGASIIPFAVALAIAAPALQTVSTSLQTLVANVTGQQLLSVGAGLLSIGAGLAAIGVGGIMALPALLGLAAIAPTLATISSIFGGGEEAGGAAAEGEGTGLNEVITKLDSLISAINNQPIQLVVNGKTLAEVVGRGTTRSGAATNK